MLYISTKLFNDPKSKAGIIYGFGDVAIVSILLPRYFLNFFINSTKLPLSSEDTGVSLPQFFTPGGQGYSISTSILDINIYLN